MPRDAARTRQLELGLEETPAAGAPARLGVTRALAAHRSRSRALALLRETLHFFPELDTAPLRVGLTRSAAGLASMESDEIWLNPYRLSRHTVAHELVHLLQCRGLVPRGEKSADIFALARHPDLADDVPAYAKVPRSFVRAWREDVEGSRAAGAGRLLHEVAAEAIRRRDAGNRRYIVWFEDELARRWEESRQDRKRKAARKISIQAALPS